MCIYIYIYIHICMFINVSYESVCICHCNIYLFTYIKTRPLNFTTVSSSNVERNWFYQHVSWILANLPNLSDFWWYICSIIKWLITLHLQHTVTHCNAMQYTAIYCNTTHCNTLQHTATHCNTHSICTVVNDWERCGQDTQDAES